MNIGGRGVVELAWRLLDRVTDEDRGGDLLALMLGTDMPQHPRDLGSAGHAPDRVHPDHELACVSEPRRIPDLIQTAVVNQLHVEAADCLLEHLRL
jgi:hypothetical protein